MNTPPPGDHPTSGQETWTAIDLLTERFRSAWRLGGRPDISPYLSETTESTCRDALLALIRVEMSERAGAGESVRVDEYLRRFPELTADSDRVLELVRDECRLRRQAGETLSPAEFAARFPAHAETIRNDLGASDVHVPPVSEYAEPDPLDGQLRSGHVIEDYEIVRLLGIGGTSSVYLARQRQLDRLVALKVSCGAPSEGIKLAALEHDSIVPVFAEHVVGRYRLLAMRYVPGATLAQLLEHFGSKDRGSLTQQELSDAVAQLTAEWPDALDAVEAPSQGRTPFVEVVCQVIRDLANALEYAHQRGVLHRDVKPENVLLTKSGRAMLVDFNVAVQLQSAGEEGTELLGGTLAYMAPEHLAALSRTEAGVGATTAVGDRVDARSDVYSLGIVLYELLMGQRPFRVVESERSLVSGTREALAERIRGAPAFPIGQKHVSPALQFIVTKCLTPTPAERYQSAGELAEDLERFLQHRPLRHARDRSWLDRLSRFRQRQARPLLAGAIGAALVVLLVGWDAGMAWYRLQEAERLVVQVLAIDSRAELSGHEDLLADAERAVARQNSLLAYPGLRRRRARLYHDCGLIHARVGDYELAIPYFERAVAADSSLAEAYNNLGIAYFRLGRVETALGAFNKAIALMGDNPEVLANRGAARTTVGDDDAARQDLQRALEISPHLEAAKRNLELLNKERALD